MALERHLELLPPGEKFFDESIANRSLENYHNSPLLKLPPEIRQKIWSHVFSDMIFLKSRSTPRNKPVKARLAYANDDGTYTIVKQPLALLYTSAQLYQETSLLPFAMNDLDTMKFDLMGWHVTANFLEGLSHNQRNTISTLHVNWLSYCEFRLAGKHKWKRVRASRRIIGQLGGLERIVVHTAVREDRVNYSGNLANKMACQWIRSITKGKEVVGNVEVLPEHLYNARYGGGQAQSAEASATRAEQDRILVNFVFLPWVLIMLSTLLVMLLWLHFCGRASSTNRYALGSGMLHV